MLISIIRTLILYVAIIFAVKLMGKRQIGELQTSELVVTLLISDIAAIPMQNTAQPLLSGFVPMMILVVSEVLLSVLMMKQSKIRKLISGKPQIVITDGKVDQKQLQRLRMSIEDLIEQLRQKDVFSIKDVEFAIIETNGQLSVLKKPEKSPPSAELLKLNPPDEFETVVISDGDFSPFSAKLCDVDKEWITKQLKENRIEQKEVFIMTINRYKEYSIILREV